MDCPNCGAEMEMGPMFWKDWIGSCDNPECWVSKVDTRVLD